MLTRKRANEFELKLSPEREGEFTARFAKFDVVDLDGDITVKTAFKNGQQIKIAQWGHNWDYIPVGKGQIRVDDTYAYVDGAFFLQTQIGRDTYETVKALGALQEWSYGFRITEKSYEDVDGITRRIIKGVDVFEASPVMVAAGVDTGTDTIKSAALESKLAAGQSIEDLYQNLSAALTDLVTTPFGGSTGYVRIVETYEDSVTVCVMSYAAMEDGYADAESYFQVPYTVADDGTVALGTPVQVEQTWTPVKAASAPETRAQWTAAYINDLPDSAFAYIESGGEKDADGKTTPRRLRHFPHHDASGSPDAPHVRNALSRIPQSKLPDAAKAKAEAHVQKHLDAMKAAGQEYHTFDHDEEAARAAVSTLLARIKSLADLRAKEGRAISTARRERVAVVRDQLRGGADELDALLTETAPEPAPEKGADAAVLSSLFLDYQRTRSRLASVGRMQ